MSAVDLQLLNIRLDQAMVEAEVQYQKGNADEALEILKEATEWSTKGLDGSSLAHADFLERVARMHKMHAPSPQALGRAIDALHAVIDVRGKILNRRKLKGDPPRHVLLLGQIERLEELALWYAQVPHWPGARHGLELAFRFREMVFFQHGKRLPDREKFIQDSAANLKRQYWCNLQYDPLGGSRPAMEQVRALVLGESHRHDWFRQDPWPVAFLSNCNTEEELLSWKVNCLKTAELCLKLSAQLPQWWHAGITLWDGWCLRNPQESQH